MAKAPDMDNNFDPENTNFFDDPEYYQGSRPSSSDPESSSEVSFEPGTPEGEEKYKQDLGAQDCQHRSMEFLGTAPDHNGENKDWFGCKNCDYFTSRHEAVQKSLANLAGDVDTGETAEGSEPDVFKLEGHNYSDSTIKYHEPRFIKRDIPVPVPGEDGETEVGSAPMVFRATSGPSRDQADRLANDRQNKEFADEKQRSDDLLAELDRRGETIQRQNMLARRTAAKHAAFIDSLRKHLNNYEG